ncbi:MAG: DNA helicase RecQ [Candidatus Aminicenantes bacterium]|nr:MAG: DNA helicase RecQ [Candidatus Aminicenantes bacterium]
MIEQAKTIMKRVFGFDEFRSLQEKVIQNVLNKKDTLVIMPTGSGKSLCYQIPALLFNGLTIVVSPLISLMKDQVEYLRELAVPTALLNSSLDYDEYMQNVSRVRKNEVKLLYVAPETLLKSNILEMLSTIPVDCLAIDEAHCISEWGHDFRPEYRQLAEVRKRFPEAVCMALTATATPRVRKDIANCLEFDQSNEFIDSFDRPNLFIRIFPKRNPFTQVIRFLEKFQNQSGIIYCATRRQVDELSELLANQDFSVRPYHAGLSDEERKENQELFIRDDVQIIVATIAFGMGINKSNIRFVVHYDLPKNIESYYQEIGRAGRDGVNAYCLMLFGYGDIHKVKYFINQKEDDVERRVAYFHLNALLRFVETEVCRRVPMLNYFGEAYTKENCGMCDNCLRKDKELTDITHLATKFLSCVDKTREIFGANHIIDVLRGSKSQKVMKFNHQNLYTYGSGMDLSRKQWFFLSRQLIQKGLLFQDPEYGSLKLTPKGEAVLNGKEKVMGIFKEERVPEVEAVKNKPAKAGVRYQDMEYDRELFEILRQRRKDLANMYNLPPYVIFSDRSLIEMAARFPRTRDSFLSIHGVGEAKLAKYGKIFIGLIDNYCKEQENA